MFEHNDIKFEEYLPELYRIMKPWTHTYLMINSRNLCDLQTKCEAIWFKFQNLLVWNKWNFTPNKYYMQGAEFILMLRKWPAKNINNMWSKNIINIPNIIWTKVHPTEKPIELYDYLLLNSSNEWDICIDPFAWSWPIIWSCIKNNRQYIVSEIDDEYIELCHKRPIKEPTLFW